MNQVPMSTDEWTGEMITIAVDRLIKYGVPRDKAMRDIGFYLDGVFINKFSESIFIEIEKEFQKAD